MSNFEILITDRSKLVKIIATGELLRTDVKNIISTGRSTAMTHDYNVVYDIRKSVLKVPFSTWYHLPRELPVYQIPNAHEESINDYQTSYEKELISGILRRVKIRGTKYAIGKSG